MGNAIDIPFPVFHDADGKPLDRGYVYVGISGLNPISNPQPVFWDLALTIPAANPSRTSVGYVVYNGKAARLYVAGDYSILVQDHNHKTLFSNLTNTVLATDLLMTASRGTIVRSMRTPPSYNLNLILESGFYSWVNQATTNMPVGMTTTDAFVLTVLSSPDGNGLVTQELRDLNNAAVFRRQSLDAGVTWNVWTSSVAGGYDLIIDSDIKLNVWCQAIAGEYPRVYIKRGTWTATALSPTAGVLINLDAAGTVEVFAEKGSSINYSASYVGIMYGLYRSIAKLDMNAEHFENVKIVITNTNVAGVAVAFYRCTNLINCTGTATAAQAATYAAYGFAYCTNLTNCTGSGTRSGTGGGIGFISCDKLVDCTGTGTGYDSVTQAGRGFHLCTRLTNCVGTGLGDRVGVNMGFTQCTYLNNCDGRGDIGFELCHYLTTCTGTGTITASGAYIAAGFMSCGELTSCTGYGSAKGVSGSDGGYGFRYCMHVVNCAGQGLDSGTGVGYGFADSTQVQQCEGVAVASTTATYHLAYADVSTNACANTTAGGYNAP